MSASTTYDPTQRDAIPTCVKFGNFLDIALDEAMKNEDKSQNPIGEALVTFKEEILCGKEFQPSKKENLKFKKALAIIFKDKSLGIITDVGYLSVPPDDEDHKHLFTEILQIVLLEQITGIKVE